MSTLLTHVQRTSIPLKPDADTNYCVEVIAKEVMVLARHDQMQGYEIDRVTLVDRGNLVLAEVDWIKPNPTNAVSFPTGS